jgi:hypothetical protein
LAWSLFALGSALCACSGGDEGGADARGADPGKPGSSPSSMQDPIVGGIAPSSTEPAEQPDLGPVGDAGLGSPGAVCATARASAELLPVHLAFAFDVSGSMGKGDEPWHDRTLKWDPVVQATRAFFEDDASAGLLASLTFFPIDADDDERCDAAVYEDPDVAMTELPSDAFGDAITEIEPESEDDWRGGTPTLFAVQGVEASIRAYREDHEGRFAIVLVTDGYPQGCDDDADTIDAVVDEVKAALDDDEIETYVIGVANPPIDDAPDTVSDLHAIAEAGGTDEAFLIDTGDPDSTTSAFGDAVSAIRGRAITCTLPIPKPPDGRAFDKRAVAVTYGSGSTETTLSYDPDCGGALTWHYDDPASPESIELCDEACGTIQADPEAELGVDFACEQLLTVD